MHIEQGIHGLEFDHDEAADQEIQPVGIIDDQVPIFDRAKLLLFKNNTAQP